MIMVRPGGEKQVFMAEKDTTKVSLSTEDTEAIGASIPNVLRVASTQNERNWNVAYGGQSIKQRVFGVTSQWADIRRSAGCTYGTSISEEDVQAARRVCVLGSQTAKTLFGDEDPVGEEILIGEDHFEVKGVFKPVGASAGRSDWDFRVIVPLSTATKRMFGRTHLEQIIIQVDDPDKVAQTAEDIRVLLRERHGIGPGDADDFFVREPEDVKQAALEIATEMSGLKLLTSGIALVIGGIVIMSIMLLSVSRRTREIGLRRAVGARKRDILGQFLAESLCVTLMGCVVGLAGGVAAAYLLSETPPKVTWVPVVVAVASCSLVALVFGLYPALKAADVDPVVALRSAEM
jgi:ABC-type antimicrobial peptide transport system permease subunit